MLVIRYATVNASRRSEAVTENIEEMTEMTEAVTGNTEQKVLVEAS